MAKRVIHISETDAASDFASLLDRVCEGAEVIIERHARPVAVVSPPENLRGRLLSEKISTLRTEQYFRERAGRANRAETLRILARAGKDGLPVEGEELPPDWKGSKVLSRKSARQPSEIKKQSRKSKTVKRK